MKKRVTLLLVIMIGVALVGCGALALSAAQAGVSIPAQMVRLMLPAVPMPAGDDPAALRALVAQNRERGPAFPSEAFRAKYEVQQGEVNGEAGRGQRRGRVDRQVAWGHRQSTAPAVHARQCLCE